MCVCVCVCVSVCVSVCVCALASLPKIIFQVIWGNWETTFKEALSSGFLPSWVPLISVQIPFFL